jgi:Ca2+-binding RTX toxin-like protein
MAIFFANTAFNYDAISFDVKDLNYLYFYEDNYFSGSTYYFYQEIYALYYFLPSEIDLTDVYYMMQSVQYSETFFAGSSGGISFSSDTAISGEFNSFEYGTDGFDWFLGWTAVSAEALDNAVSTSDVADDLELFASLLDGNDEIYLSNYSDNFKAGAGDDIVYGFGGNDTLDGGIGSDTLVGGDGNDRYVTDGSDTIIEEASAGTDTVRASVTYLLGENLEYLILTGMEDINGTGNNLNNRINGNSGANILNGGTGADTLVGSGGDDVYITNGSDTITELADGGTDTVRASVSYVMGANIENLTLTGSAEIDGAGNSLNNLLNGNSGNNILTGDAGDDTLNGGTGADSMDGGDGNDVYMTNGGDTITELADGGTDTVNSSLSYILAANLENLTLTGSSELNGTGNSLNNVLTGNSANNILTGNEGNDTLSGVVGADTLVGGTGNDRYVTDGGDTITESLNAGTDTVVSSVSYTLGSNLEYLTLTGTTAVNAFGNSLNNIITGNSANNVLNGLAGADTLIGGDGDDIYVTNGSDTITEAGHSGIDLVRSSVTFILGSNLENLTLTGTAAIDGTGNNLNNMIIGNSAANTLNGHTGSDTLIGGAGDDIYITNGGDTITEAVNAGTDLVQSSASFVLSSNLENLTLTGTSATTGSGNYLSNLILGNDAANIIYGAGGIDTLTGGNGADTFVFKSITDSTTLVTTADVITDFVDGQDKINLADLDAFATTSSNDSFVWRGTSAFNSATQGEVRHQRFYDSVADDYYTMIWVDTDNDSGVEMAIRMTGQHYLNASDFIL